MSENMNNIPENSNETTFSAPENYLDFIVEDDVYDIPEKKFSVKKLLALIFGIISGLSMLYYSVEYLNANLTQISQYTQMGIQLPMVSLITVYLGIALTFSLSIAPIVGALLPKKYTKCSILLFMVPVSYTLVNALPQLILCVANNIPFAEAYPIYLMTVSGVFALASSILSLFIKDCCCDDAEVEFYEYEDDNYFEIDEKTEELLEEADKEIEELLENNEEKAE